MLIALVLVTKCAVVFLLHAGCLVKLTRFLSRNPIVRDANEILS